MSNRNKIDVLDVHQTIWRCRDFELTYLWQRSIFLTAFLVLCFTGYGFLLFEMIKEPTCKWPLSIVANDNTLTNEVLNVVAIGLSLIGFLFSSLWIKMAKGSKAWYERYERAIYAIETDKKFIRHRAMPIGAFQYIYLDNFEPDSVDNRLYKMDGGAFSPSKINIAIGQISMLIWILLFIIHCCILSVLYYDFKWPITNIHYITIFVLIVFAIAVVCFALSSWVDSTAIEETKNKKIKMGNDEFILYIRKRTTSCKYNNDELEDLIWKWISTKDKNAKKKPVTPQKSLWSVSENVNEFMLPESSYQFEFKKSLLLDLYTYLDCLAKNKK